MKRSFVVIILFLIFIFRADTASAASLRVGPSSGALVVGSTFDVSIFLDTEDKAVNALEVSLSFPPDKLQLVSPSTGQSIVGVWTAQPRFNNATGRIDLQGGIPGGINVSNGLVTTLTFRVRAVGSAVLRFLDNSRVLLHDGLGTDDLMDTQNGVYSLILPPPAGPIVASETHPNQSEWYPNSSVVLSWAGDPTADGYSYVVSEKPIDVPDDISEGVKAIVVYKNLSDGTQYFHIRALRSGIWGGVTHFALNIDATPPADFQVQVIPGRRTTTKEPVIQFFTTDLLSGIDHYELKLVSLKNPEPKEETGRSLFVEAGSPYVTQELLLGNYDVIVRAYDKAGNYRDVTERINVVTPIFRFVQDEGLEVRGIFVVPWFTVWIILGLVIAGLGALAVWAQGRHQVFHTRLAVKELPAHLKKQLTELKHYRKKYGKALVLLIGLIGFMGFMGPIDVVAQSIELSPPLVTSISRNISNEEIFYAGGKTDVTNTSVIIYLQNLETGETLSQTIQSDRRGDWFYRHDGFLSTGNYLLWAQTRLGDQVSPPSPQIAMTVRPTAIQFGASRISFETLYFILTLILFLVVLGLVFYIISHAYQSRRKHQRFWKEIKEAEESLRRGFAVLRRDIQAELALVKKAKLSRVFKEEETRRETELLKDLENIERYIGKEIWDVEQTEHLDY